MINLSFRAPTGGHPLIELLPMTYPDVREEIYPEMLLYARVRVEGEVETDGEFCPTPGALVQLLGDDQDLLPINAGLPEIIAEGEGWVALQKPRGPIGASLGVPMEFLEGWARALGQEQGRLDPLIELDPDVEGLWLLAKGRDQGKALKASVKGATLHLRALIPRIYAGPFSLRDGGLNALITPMEQEGQVLEVNIALKGGRLLELRRALSRAGATILGDLRFGGVGTPGGIRLQAVALESALTEEPIKLSNPKIPWPKNTSPFPAEVNVPAPVLPVSDATLSALEGGHRWCLPDAELGDMAAYLPGTLVRLEGRGGGRGPAALIEGPGVIAARVWGKKAHQEDLKARFGKAMGRRQELIASDVTDVYRLVHGEGDGLPGLEVDRYGSVIRVMVTGRAAEAILLPVESYLQRRFPDLTHLRLYHVRGIQGTQSIVTHRGGRGPAPGDVVFVQERGLRFRVDPWGGHGTGFFADQRENRERLEGRARKGSRWLNLFSHTGAFSAALLRKGVNVTSVDLSGSYLEWLEENLSLNDLKGENHTSVKRDVRTFLEETKVTYHGIICDPPAAAAAGRKFWSVKKAYPELLRLATAKLAKGGVLLACRNHRHRKPPLLDMVKEAATRARVDVRSLGKAGPGLDFPSIQGFIPGDTFEGAMIKRVPERYHPLGIGSSKRGRRASR